MATGPERGRAGIAGDNKADPGARAQLARKEKALAEAAALLGAQKKVQALEQDEDVNTGEEDERWFWPP
jgi:hypothetical protein